MRDYPAFELRLDSRDLPLVDLVAPIVDDFQPTAIEEDEAGGVVRVFFVDETSRREAMAAAAAALPAARLTAIDVSDEDWAARSQAALTAVRVGGVTVAPPWDAPDDGRPAVIILPSTGFGTGHHATTRLCLAALQAAEPRGKSVVDVGTGSGVLALAAARLGASRAIGIDNDQDAIDNALENRALNAADGVEFSRAGLEEWSTQGPFDIVLANLTGAVLQRLAHPLAALAAPGGRLILSGLREEEERDVQAAFARPLIARASEDGWICLTV